MQGYISFGSRRGRFLLVLLASLEHFGQPCPREKVLSFVRDKGFLNLSDADFEPTAKSSEPKWQNDLSWARKDAVEHGYLNRRSAHGYWELSEKGLQRLSGYRTRIANGQAQLRPGRLLSESFVQWFSRNAKTHG